MLFGQPFKDISLINEKLYSLHPPSEGGKKYDVKFEENSKYCEAKKVLRRGRRSINI